MNKKFTCDTSGFCSQSQATSWSSTYYTWFEMNSWKHIDKKLATNCIKQKHIVTLIPRSKFTILPTSLKPFQHNTLPGFCTVDRALSSKLNIILRLQLNFSNKNFKVFKIFYDVYLVE